MNSFWTSVIKCLAQNVRPFVGHFGALLRRDPPAISLACFMRCAKGIFAKGILGYTGFSLLRCEKGSATPSSGGENGLRLHGSLGRSMRNEGVSDPFPIARGSLRPFFPPQKGKPRTSPNPLSENPLSAAHDCFFCHSQFQAQFQSALASGSQAQCPFLVPWRATLNQRRKILPIKATQNNKVHPNTFF